MIDREPHNAARSGGATLMMRLNASEAAGWRPPRLAQMRRNDASSALGSRPPGESRLRWQTETFVNSPTDPKQRASLIVRAVRHGYSLDEHTWLVISLRLLTTVTTLARCLSRASWLPIGR